MRDILDSGYVDPIEFWGSDERIIEAARMSTGKGFQGWDTDAKLLAYLYNNNHVTPFEMAGMVIEVKAPIFVFREWHRHRTQSYNEMSARYIPLPDENYIPTVERLMMPGGANKQAQGTGKTLSQADAENFVDALRASYALAQNVYEQGLSLGVPKELARLSVPVARYSRMRASANLRNWLAFLTLRMDPAAQWEIRQYANAVGALITERFPRTWALFDTKRSAAVEGLPAAKQEGAEDARQSADHSTPRVNALEAKPHWKAIEMHDLARTLEQELATARAQIDEDRSGTEFPGTGGTIIDRGRNRRWNRRSRKGTRLDRENP